MISCVTWLIWHRDLLFRSRVCKKFWLYFRESGSDITQIQRRDAATRILTLQYHIAELISRISTADNVTKHIQVLWMDTEVWLRTLLDGGSLSVRRSSVLLVSSKDWKNNKRDWWEWCQSVSRRYQESLSETYLERAMNTVNISVDLMRGDRLESSTRDVRTWMCPIQMTTRQNISRTVENQETRRSRSRPLTQHDCKNCLNMIHRDTNTNARPQQVRHQQRSQQTHDDTNQSSNDTDWHDAGRWQSTNVTSEVQTQVASGTHHLDNDKNLYASNTYHPTQQEVQRDWNDYDQNDVMNGEGNDKLLQ